MFEQSCLIEIRSIIVLFHLTKTSNIMFKLRLYKLLGIFIPYFKNKYMTEIQNQLKRLFDTLIDKYEDKSLFGMTEISNTSKINSIAYTITHASASMLVRIEYLDFKILIEFTGMIFPTREESVKMIKLIEYLESIPQEELLKKITF